MDMQLTQSLVTALPSSERVDAIIHDGTTDLRPWPRPGPERDLLEHYGPDLPKVLERERARLDGGELPLGGMLRLHRGKLHCDFLLWVATRGPEEKGQRANAPDAETLTKAVKDALAFCSERHVARVALGPLGEGPGELDEVERLVLVAKAAAAYYDERFKAGQSAGIEEVLVCHPFASRITAARRALGRAVSVVQPPTMVALTAEKPTRRRTTKSTGTKKSTRKTAPTLSEDEIGRAKATAGGYDRATTYTPGDYFVHTKFGVGRVEEVTREGFIMVLFESGETKRLLHARP